jgi:hypothetical protein
MPKDKRLYMTFPIDFDEHPKVEPLSDAAFRAFVAMNGYSRRQKLDGRIPAVIAKKRWKVRVLSELVASHSERPLVVLDGDAYVLRSYADHQFTTADEAELHEERAKAGSKGGKASAEARAIRKQLLEQGSSKNEAEIGIEITTSNEVVGAAKRGSRIPANFTVTAEMVAWAQEHAPLVNGKLATEKFINYWLAKSGRDATKLDWVLTWKNWMLTDQERQGTPRLPERPQQPKKVFTAHVD